MTNLKRLRTDAEKAKESGPLLVRVHPDVVLKLLAVVEAARSLYEEVEMGESVGICLVRRGPSLLLGDALAALESAPGTARAEEGEKA